MKELNELVDMYVACRTDAARQECAQQMRQLMEEQGFDTDLKIDPKKIKERVAQILRMKDEGEDNE